MGSCDNRAGTLVWVRRPNGSWWPGLVMAPDELPKRKKGTPVKLLGREDGSMDWYDLQKSKRIKAFRCGEYDDCIEKAKASAVCNSRADRKGKYAKRGDAILHALELERAYHANGTNKFPLKEQNYMAKRFTKQEKEMELSQSVISIEHDVSTPNLKLKKRCKNQSDSDDDTMAGIKRMKGLQDLGIKSKREFDTVEGTKLQEHATQNDEPVRFTNISKGFLHQRNANNLSSKRCSQVSQLNDIFKRKDRRRPLTKVLESTARLVVPSSCNQKSSSGKSSVLGILQNKSSTLDSSESRKTDLSVVLNDNSGCSDDSHEEAPGPDAHEDTCHATTDETILDSEIKDIKPLALADVDDTSCYGLSDVPIFMVGTYTKDVSHLFATDSCCAMAEEQSNHCSETGKISDKKDVHVPCFSSPVKQNGTGDTSKCSHLKGKRSSKCQRTLAECYMMNGSHGDGSSTGSDHNTLYESSNSDGQIARHGMFSHEVENGNAKQITEDPDPPYCSKEQEFGAKKFAAHFNNRDHDYQTVTSHEKQVETNFASTSSDFSFQSQKFTSQQQADQCMDYQDLKLKDKTSTDSFLYEVIVDMQSGYKKSRVPLVSLVSKLNGKAIVGHPISVEATESSSDLANGINACSLVCKTKECKVKNAYKRKAGVQFLQNGYHCKIHNHQQRNKHASARSLKAQKGSCKNSRSKSVRSKKKSSRVMGSEILSHKIRKLSSIVEYTKKKEHMGNKLKGPVVACVPLKLVFSRIHEALGRSS